MGYLKVGTVVETLEGITAIVEWIKPRNEVMGYDSPVLLGDLVKLVDTDLLEFPHDLTWDGMFDDMPIENEEAGDVNADFDSSASDNRV